MADTQVVGGLVGPISYQVAAAAAERYTRDGLEYDFAIGGLPFVCAISDDRPYARETAEFKKTQVDQSQTVGDQSLTGYWTRGQSSFHRGAGIKFYEVLEGDTITNRYTDSLDVDPWTPGELTLKKKLVNINTTPVIDAFAHASGILELTNAGLARTVTLAGTATAKASTTGATFTSITTNGTDSFGAVANRIERLVGTGSFTALWTHHVGGRTWDKVFWAKDRIWAVDNTGEWYTLSTVGGVTSASDILWTTNKAGAHWSLAEGEGGVYVATNSSVFLSTVDTSTTTPILLTPTVVATVGAQEHIYNIGAYLGYILVLSDGGARLGAIQNNGVILGNLIVESDFTNCARVSYRKNLIQATGSEQLIEFNPLEQITDLSAAYSPARDVNTGVSGSFVLSDGRTVVFSTLGLDLESDTDLVDTGHLQTAFHRFGTLEPKDFRTLTIRAQGTGGTIAIEKILRDGTTISMVNLGVDNFYDNEIALNIGAPTDYIGLRFTIIAIDGLAPTLLGYQLRALPAPQRQRLIQVPLFVMDYEMVGGVQVGHPGWAWERLSALEELEETSEVVILQDFRTGETATVSIEQLQHQGKTPPGKGEGNFGGYLVVTARKVS